MDHMCSPGSLCSVHFCLVVLEGWSWRRQGHMGTVSPQAHMSNSLLCWAKGAARRCISLSSGAGVGSRCCGNIGFPLKTCSSPPLRMQGRTALNSGPLHVSPGLCRSWCLDPPQTSHCGTTGSPCKPPHSRLLHTGNPNAHACICPYQSQNKVTAAHDWEDGGQRL